MDFAKHITLAEFNIPYSGYIRSTGDRVWRTTAMAIGGTHLSPPLWNPPSKPYPVRKLTHEEISHCRY